MSDSRLSVLPVGADEGAFEVTRVVDGQKLPLELHGTSLRLFVREIVVAETDGRVRTESYGYRLQRDNGRSSWLMRWEYLRQRPFADYPYPPAHLHVDGAFARHDGVLAKLHIPTRRLPLEMVLWHLIAEWGVTPKREDWRQLLEESIDDAVADGGWRGA